MTHTLPAQITTEMTRRHRRFRHYLWHRVRDTWLRLADGEQRAVREISPRWVPPRPSLDTQGWPLRDNDSGEDFLFMQLRAITLRNKLMNCAGLRGDSLQGWRRVPPPGDHEYPVPEFPDSGLEEIKSAEYYEKYIAKWEQQYADADYLRSVTLGQFGSDLESTIYNDAHMRWAGPSAVGYRPTTAVTQAIDLRWDTPDYYYLGDTYSSMVNPVFWNLLAWIGERVNDWYHANGIKSWPEWAGKWIGPDAWSLAPNLGIAQEEVEMIDRIISASRASDVDGFFRPEPKRRLSSSYLL